MARKYNPFLEKIHIALYHIYAILREAGYDSKYFRKYEKERITLTRGHMKGIGLLASGIMEILKGEKVEIKFPKKEKDLLKDIHMVLYEIFKVLDDVFSKLGYKNKYFERYKKEGGCPYISQKKEYHKKCVELLVDGLLGIGEIKQEVVAEIKKKIKKRR